MDAMTTPNLKLLRSKPCCHQRGAAVLILMLIVMLGLITIFSFRMDHKAPELNADRQTALALVQAKEALLGYAASDVNRPGSLPCPDINDDGLSRTGVDYPCSQIVARLPWQELGLQDLRDGAGERLWYAISPVFAANRTTALNSISTLGQITIRNSQGTVIFDASASPSTGVIAVIVAPGQVLTRQGATNPQDRSCTGGGGCNANLVCQAPYQSVAKCAPQNYLDILMGSEDNSNFVSPPPTTPQNGFILGPIIDASGRTIVNDRLLLITASDIFPMIKKRIFGEIRGSAAQTMNCSSLSTVTGLIGYAATHGTFYPWAAATFIGPSAFSGTANTYVGYLPANDINFAERTSNGTPYCQWNVMQANGWDRLITYEVSKAFAPGGSGNCGAAGANCLVVNGAPNAKVRVTIDSTDFGIW
jgi:hypothetical protein